jgi:hypothetical protein
MQLTIPVIVLFILTVFIFLLGSGSPQQSKKNNPSKTPPVVMNQQSSRNVIVARLAKLANSKPPNLIKIGAMCYRIALPPNRAEYCCPVCGEKTLYSNESQLARIILVEIPEIRRIIQSINDTSIRATIDESAFCSKCTPNAKSRQVCLTVSYSNDPLLHTTCPVTQDDIRLLQEFISGKQIHKMERDAEAPLVDYMKRLEELLGISVRKREPGKH